MSKTDATSVIRDSRATSGTSRRSEVPLPDPLNENLSNEAVAVGADCLPAEQQAPQTPGFPEMRVGIGYDVHALVPGRACVIGGVVFDEPQGLLGHSDADVLAHAVTDALLGAAGLGDIGRLFPDSDAQFRHADSMGLLAAAWAKVRAAGWQLGNLDAVVICERPRLAPKIDAICARLAQALQVEPTRVHVKGKTHERLGFLGRREGIAAHAVALLWRVRP